MEDKQLTTKAPAELIFQAVKSDTDLDKLAKALELQERWEANQAKKAYHKAMAEFKANPPIIGKDKHVKYDTSKGKMDYHHASLANICEKINTELSKHGLSASWATKQNGAIQVTCKITHEQGHSEETTLSAKEDLTGSKNSIQAIGSTITYLQRYTLLSITGLATRDQDDDGQASEQAELINSDQVVYLKNLANEKNISEERVLKFLKIDSFDKVTIKGFARATKAIRDHKGAE